MSTRASYLQPMRRIQCVHFVGIGGAGMSGIELAHQLRKDYPDLPVLLTTGYFNAVDKPIAWRAAPKKIVDG